jgi:hypothetical protein
VPAQKPQIIPLRTRVQFEGTETIVIGNDLDGWVMILIPPYMKRSDGTHIAGETIVELEDASIDPDYVGQRGLWLSPGGIIANLQILSAVPKGPDGCTCIHCTKFCQMAVNNLMNTAELSDVNIPPSKVKKAFACYSCRDTVAWWIAAQGWTYTG